MHDVSRRTLLAAIPLSAITLVNTSSSFGQPDTDAELLITPADSLLNYKVLLEQVRGDALSYAGRTVNLHLEECSAVVHRLQAKLTQLKDALQIPGEADRLKNQSYVNRLNQSLEFIHELNTYSPGEFLVRAAPVSIDAMLELVREIAGDCDLKRDGIKNVLDEIFLEITKYNEQFDDYKHRVKSWEEQADEINGLISRCRTKLDVATATLADGNELSHKNLQDVQVNLTGILQELSSVKVLPTASARSILTEALNAVLRMLQPSPIQEAAYGMWNLLIQSPQNVPVLPLKSSVVQNVKQIIHNRDYFSPGSTFQVVVCMTVCFPFWVSYSDVNVRADLIGAALWQHMVWGVKDEKIDKEIAPKLANAFPVLRT